MKVTDPTPINVKPYPVPHAKSDTIEREINYLLANKIIAPSTSPYNAPVVLVKKPDDSHRMCIDFPRLNAVTEFQVEPIVDTDLLFSE